MSEPIIEGLLRTFGEERDTALTTLQRAIDDERDPLLRAVYLSAQRIVRRHGSPVAAGLAADVLALAARDHPEPTPAGVDPYGTTRMDFDDGNPP